MQLKFHNVLQKQVIHKGKWRNQVLPWICMVLFYDNVKIVINILGHLYLFCKIFTEFEIYIFNMHLLKFFLLGQMKANVMLHQIL